MTACAVLSGLDRKVHRILFARMQVYYADHFVLPLPAGHRFPMQKYRLLRDRVAAELPCVRLREAPAARDTDLRRVHDAGYIDRVRRGTLDAASLRRIGFPWSPAMVERSLRSVGATIAASRAAADAGVAASLAGGTHHAFADRGEGFCVFNDVAVAVRVMQAEGRASRVAIIDCDVHQGNGTAAIFAADRDVFTFSVHGAANFPFHKERSDLDIALPDGAGDTDCIAAVRQGVGEALGARPDLVYYLAGADPFEGDRLGRLNVTKAALAARDAIVLGGCAAAAVPVTLVMAGGYAADVDDIVDIHFSSVRTACEGSVRVSATSTMR
jgi:acetoin utilization deacetylase AcuC-like enzyme